MDHIPIAKFQNVHVYCQQSSRLSFFNSPWFPHRQGHAIDIYDGCFGGEVCSPVEGEILAIKRFHSPESKYFKSHPWEWGILIKPFTNESICFKILHAEPRVKKGEEIHIGNSIGTYIRNGYFEPWTGPHLHLEIRNRTSSLNAMFRASGALSFESLITPEAMRNPAEEMVGQIKQINTHFISVELEEEKRNSNWMGFPAKVGSNVCLVDGGLAYYDKFGGILGNTSNVFPKTPIFVGNQIIGHIVRSLGPRRAIVRFLPIKISIDKENVLGLSLSTTFASSQFKIVDRNLKQLSLEEGEEITIKILGDTLLAESSGKNLG